MLDNANLIRKTRFPRQLVPLSAVATQLVTFAVMLAVLLVLNMALIPEVRGTAWLAIPLAALFVCFVGGLAVAVAAANVLFRDVEHLIGSLLLPWFFLTPILYSFDQIPRLRPALDARVACCAGANPVTPPIEAIRAPLWEGSRRRPATSSTSASRPSSRSRSARGCSRGPTTGSRSSSDG